MSKINIVLDYKNRFESKFTAIPYRSGFDKELLKQSFNDYGYEIRYITFPEIDFREFDFRNQIFLYCSSEDRNNYYKSFIEDIILGLKLAGAIVIPDYVFLKAQNNKLFMEILREIYGESQIRNLKTKYFSTIEDLLKQRPNISKGRYVLKPSMGAMSEGVSSVSSFGMLLKNAKVISRTKDIKDELKDIIRRFIHRNYIPDSRFRKKFILQEMIQGLTGDWKVLIYSGKYFVLKRRNRDNDFRASGSGLLSYERNLPDGLLDFANVVFNCFNVPALSVDIGFDGNTFYLIEFQSLYFGSYTIENSSFYFVRETDIWHIIEGKSILEQEYARSVVEYIKRNSF